MNQKNSTIANYEFYPDIKFLHILARGSLKQNLPKAVRLWVILRSIYGSQTDPIKVELPDKFTYTEWCKEFFTAEFEKYHRSDKIPENHDPNCPCAKTIPDWLFEPNNNIDAKTEKWKKSFTQFYEINSEQLNNLLDFGIVSPAKDHKKNQKLRLLAQTRRNFQNDFKALVEMNCLESQKSKKQEHLNYHQTQYTKVLSLPEIITDSSSEITENQQVGNIIQSDLADFFEDFGREINHEQRFFLELEYIVDYKLSITINQYRKKLKEIWGKQPIPPLKITYVSARKSQNHQHNGEIYIVYPVCIYYSQRASYLFAYGQTPSDESSIKIDWYDYRLDRIKSLEVLEWKSINLPNFSQEICELKTPGEIEDKRSEAWGFDFYKPQDVMLIRFEQKFYDLYIKGTERENLFKRIPYRQAESLIRGSKDNLKQKQQLLRIIKFRSDKDIYCRVNYRKYDNNIIMRLRAWGAKVEVLSPWDLRQTMAENFQKTWELYQS